VHTDVCRERRFGGVFAGRSSLVRGMAREAADNGAFDQRGELPQEWPAFGDCRPAELPARAPLCPWYMPPPIIDPTMIIVASSRVSRVVETLVEAAIDSAPPRPVCPRGGAIFSGTIPRSSAGVARQISRSSGARFAWPWRLYGRPVRRRSGYELPPRLSYRHRLDCEDCADSKAPAAAA